MYARVVFQRIEIREVRQVAQQDDSHIDTSTLCRDGLLCQRDAVLLLNVDILEVGYHAQHGHAADVLEHLATIIKESQVATELIDDDALDHPAVFLRLQGYAAIDRGEDAAAVYVTHQDDVGLGMARHRQVHQIMVAQVEFRDAARTLHHDGMIAGGQAVEGRADLLTK